MERKRSVLGTRKFLTPAQQGRRKRGRGGMAPTFQTGGMAPPLSRPPCSKVKGTPVDVLLNV